MTTTKHKMESYSAESFEARKNPDRSLRRVIDLEIRHFFQCLDMDHRDGLARHLADGAILIDLQYFPDEVLVSEKAVVENLRFYYASDDQRTAHRLLLVDRGRVTCYVTHFRKCRSSPQNKFAESRGVYIIDFDESHRIRRIERRPGRGEDGAWHDGGLAEMGNMVDEIESKAIRMT